MLTRTQLAAKYGSFDQLMENRAEHGGYGNVTWNVGPHAGPQPYGPDHNVVFVDRNKLLSGFRPKAPEEVERESQAIGQQMDRGDVIHVPHVKFAGSAPVLDSKHAASIQAAGQRGADKIPVVVHKNDALALQLHVGGAQKPGAPMPGQDKSYKWRWNGRGWYTKPSFNMGKCPPGTGAAQGKDQCVGGGEPPKLNNARQMTPAGLYGSQSLPPGRAPEGDPFAPPKPKIQQRAPIPARFGAPVAAARPRPATPAPEPESKSPPGPSRPLPPPISKGEVAQHTAITDGRGLDARIFAGRSQVQASMQRSGQKAAAALKSLAPHLKIGKLYGCGLSGCAYAGPEEPDGTPTVVKMDKGENEATMAKLLLRHKDLGQLSSVPRYIEAVDTGVDDDYTGMRVHAIHREDLRDFSPKEGDLKRFFGSFGMELHSLSTRAPKMNRGALLRKYDEIVGEFNPMARRDPNIATQFARVSADTRKLLERGIAPCDAHEENWGMRDKTGEVVMRDVGCAHFSRDIA